MARRLSPTQIEAIRKAMRIFLEDDLARGVSSRRLFYCPACLSTTSAAGAIRYGTTIICNECSIQYELARARGVVQDLADFLTTQEATLTRKSAGISRGL